MYQTVLVLFAVGLLAACQTSGTAYKPVSESLPTLTVTFADPAWTGKAVPTTGVCSKNGGKGDSPALTVSGIPAGANALIVEFSDRNYAPCDNGGHGSVGYKIAPGATSVTLKPVPGMTTGSLPEGTWIEGGNCQGSGYLAPCSGGRGNTYEADVKAVYKPVKDGEEGKLLAKGRIRLGTY